MCDKSERRIQQVVLLGRQPNPQCVDSRFASRSESFISGPGHSNSISSFCLWPSIGLRSVESRLLLELPPASHPRQHIQDKRVGRMNAKGPSLLCSTSRRVHIGAWDDCSIRKKANPHVELNLAKVLHFNLTINSSPKCPSGVQILHISSEFPP